MHLMVFWKCTKFALLLETASATKVCWVSTLVRSIQGPLLGFCWLSHDMCHWIWDSDSSVGWNMGSGSSRSILNRLIQERYESFGLVLLFRSYCVKVSGYQDLPKKYLTVEVFNKQLWIHIFLIFIYYLQSCFIRISLTCQYELHSLCPLWESQELSVNLHLQWCAKWKIYLFCDIFVSRWGCGICFSFQGRNTMADFLLTWHSRDKCRHSFPYL